MDILLEFKDQIIAIGSFFDFPVLTFIVALGAVFLFGRMLGLVGSDRAKNAVALAVMSIVYAVNFLVVDIKSDPIHRAWIGAVYLFSTIILYVLIGFKLYDRMDDFLDRHFGKDKPVRQPSRKRKTK